MTPAPGGVTNVPPPVNSPLRMPLRTFLVVEEEEGQTTGVGLGSGDNRWRKNVRLEHRDQWSPRPAASPTGTKKAVSPSLRRRGGRCRAVRIDELRGQRSLRRLQTEFKWNAREVWDGTLESGGICSEKIRLTSFPSFLPFSNEVEEESSGIRPRRCIDGYRLCRIVAAAPGLRSRLMKRGYQATNQDGIDARVFRQLAFQTLAELLSLRRALIFLRPGSVVRGRSVGRSLGSAAKAAAAESAECSRGLKLF